MLNVKTTHKGETVNKPIDSSVTVGVFVSIFNDGNDEYERSEEIGLSTLSASECS
jgi:hypothetical protein